jgi:hypothetical protein
MQILWCWATSRLLSMGIPVQLMVDIVLLTMAFVLTTYNFVGKHAIWKGLDWECLLTSLLPSCHMCVWWKGFFATLHIVSKYQFSSKFWLEFGQYITTNRKVLLKRRTFMKILILFYIYLLFNRIGINIKKDVLGFRSLLSLVQSTNTYFPVEQKFYKYEISLEVLKTILDLILWSGMGCLSVYETRALIHLCLVSISLECVNVLRKYIQIQFLQVFFLLCSRRESARYLTLFLKTWDK